MLLCRTFAVRGLPDCLSGIQLIEIIGAPYGNRTRVSALRGPRPRPLDEGSSALEIARIIALRKPRPSAASAAIIIAAQSTATVCCHCRRSSLRLDHEPQSARRAQGFGIEGADFERTAYIYHNDDAVVGDRGRNHTGALGQQRRGL